MLVRVDENAPPPFAVVETEFAKDGKMMLSVTVGKQNVTVNGSYSVEGDTLKTKITTPDGQKISGTSTITRLTDKELSFKDSKGQKSELKRK